MKKAAFSCIIVFFALLAGCGRAPDVIEVPTLAQLPTLTPTAGTSVPPTFTATETAIPADTPTASPTQPPTLTLTPAPSTTPTVTPGATFTPSSMDTPAPTLTPSMTITDTPTPTITPLPPPTADNDAITSLLGLAMQATILPQQFVQPSAPPAVSISCANAAPTGLNALYAADPAFAAQLGCPVGAPPTAMRLVGASQAFERGVMIYVGDPQRAIYAIFDDGHFRRFPDTWAEGADPVSGGETPPSGLVEPIRGFGKVWRQNADVRAGLGWARGQEQAEDLSVLAFDRGQIVSPPRLGRAFALAEDAGGQSGSWRATTGVP